MFSVTRSQHRVMDENEVRECHVGIPTSLPAVTMAWLSEERPPQSSIPGAADLVSSAGPSRPLTSGEAARPVPTQRRASIASCQNMFDIGGGIVEVGFDRLKKIDCHQKTGSSEETSRSEKNKSGLWAVVTIHCFEF